MDTQVSEQIQQYIEDYSIFAAAAGLPRMAGKILGWLMVCSPPYQTAEEIETALGASAGTVSTMTRMLVQVGVIEKVGIPGQRRACFRVKEDVWVRLTANEYNQAQLLRKLAERGLELLADAPPEDQKRLEEMREMFAFFERELPALIERFYQERAQRP